VPNSSSDGKYYEKRRCRYICPPKEGILTPYPRHGGYHNRLCARVYSDREIYVYTDQRIDSEDPNEGLTHVDGNLVASLNKFTLVVATVELCKCRETGCAHPVLEVFINVKIGRRVLCCVAVGELHGPVGRRYYLREIIRQRVGIFLRLAWPGDALL
jgi:hypothetical protein